MCEREGERVKDRKRVYSAQGFFGIVTSYNTVYVYHNKLNFDIALLGSHSTDT